MVKTFSVICLFLVIYFYSSYYSFINLNIYLLLFCTTRTHTNNFTYVYRSKQNKSFSKKTNEIEFKILPCSDNLFRKWTTSIFPCFDALIFRVMILSIHFCGNWSFIVCGNFPINLLITLNLFQNKMFIKCTNRKYSWEKLSISENFILSFFLADLHLLFCFVFKTFGIRLFNSISKSL